MAYIISTNSAFPKNYYPQAELTEAFLKHVHEDKLNEKLVKRIHESVHVDGRYLALPKEAYATLKDFGERNHAWREVALELAQKCVSGLLENAGLPANEVSQIIFTTVTGIAVPSIDARLVNFLGFSPHIKRVPLFGLGCVAGVAGIARAYDYLKGHPEDAVVLLSVELCSLTVQVNDKSSANIVGSGLFGDGCAAALMVGENHRLAKGGAPRIIDSRSIFFPNTESVMGWEIVKDGFKLVLSADVPTVAEKLFPPAVRDFLQAKGLNFEDIETFISHPGGPKVIDAIERGFKLKPNALALSRESLRKYGNISSSSVLCVLKETLEKAHRAGSYGLMLAMGPGFCSEAVLLQW